MKKLILLTLAVFAFSAVFSQTNEKAGTKESKEEQKALLQKEKRADRKELAKLTGKDVDVVSKRQFNADFGNVPAIKWKRDLYYDEATFSKDGKEYNAFYDSDGKLVGTASAATFAELPPNAQKFIKEKYKDYKIGEVVNFNDNESNINDMVFFNEQFDDEDSYFVVVEKDAKKTVLQVDSAGFVYFFTNMK